METASLTSLGTAAVLLVASAAQGQAVQGPPFCEKWSNYCACLSADGKKLAIGGVDWAIWDVPGGRKLRVGETWGTHGIALSPDGRFLAVGGNYAHLHIIDAQTGEVRWNLTGKGHLTVVTHLEFTPDGALLLSCGSDCMLRSWDVGKGTPQAVFRFSSTVKFADAWKHPPPEFAPERAKLVVNVDGLIKDLYDFSISPDGKRVAIACGTAEVKLIEVATGKVLQTLRTLHDCTVSVRYSRDGSLLAVGGALDKGTIEIWDAARATRLTTLKGHKESVLELAFSPDGRTLVSGGLVDGARVWDLQTGKERFACHQGKETRVVGVGFLPDGKAFFTLPHDPGCFVQFWDTATGREVSPVQGGRPRDKDR
jgi:WD40 repeat protein